MKSPKLKPDDICVSARELEYKSKLVRIHKSRSETLAKRVVIVCEAAKDVVPVTSGMFKYQDMLYVCLEEISKFFDIISHEPKMLTNFIMKEGQNEITFVKWNEALQNVVAELFIENISIPEVFDPATDAFDYDRDITELEKLLKSSAIFNDQNTRETALQLLTSQKSERGKFSTKISPDSKVNIDPKFVRIEREIGRGGFGIVYKARYRGEEVAVKSIPENQINEKTLKALQIEANLMRRLSHPRIVAGYGFYQHEQSYCVIMEFLPNGSLSSYISANLTCPWDKRIDFALDIAQGMAFLHKMAIVHRDLKPGNIVLDAHDRAKITDFGLSVIRSNSTTSISAGEAGTTAYMVEPNLTQAPENFGLSPTYSTKSDVFAFSMILWELSHWKTSYDGVIISEIKDSIRKGERLEIDESIPKSIAGLVKLCWDQDPRKRPSFDEITTYFQDFTETNTAKIKQPLAVILGPPPTRAMRNTSEPARIVEVTNSSTKKEKFTPSTINWRKRKYLLYGCLVIALISIGVGVVVGLVTQSKSSSPNSLTFSRTKSFDLSSTSAIVPSSVTSSSFFTPTVSKLDSAYNYFASLYAGSPFLAAGSTIGPLGDALFNNPSGVAVDANDNVFVADSSNYVIKRINAKTGYVSVIAGSTSYSAGSAEGAALTEARFAFPTRLCVQYDGSLIIVDQQRIKKLDANFSTVVYLHNGIDPRSVYCDRTNGDVWVTDGTLNTVYTISSTTGLVLKSYGSSIQGYLDGPSAVAKFDTPDGITKDSLGNVYVGDTGNFAIRVIRTGNDTVETLAGFNRTDGYLDGPISKAIVGKVISLETDSQGNLIFIQTANSFNLIRKVNLNEAPHNVTSIIAGYQYGYLNGLGAFAKGDNFNQLALNSRGDILSVVYYDNNVRLIQKISSLPPFNYTNSNVVSLPTGICQQYGPIYYNVSIYVGSSSKSSGYLDGSLSTALFNKPSGIAIDANNNFYIADSGNYVIRYINRTSKMVQTIAGTPNSPGRANGNAIGVAKFTSVERVCVLKDDSLIILDSPYVRKLDSNWTRVTTLLSGGILTSIFCDNDVVWITDATANIIYAVSATGALLKTYGSGVNGFLDGPISNAQFSNPQSVLKDSVGNLWIADGQNRRIRALRPDGNVETIAGNGNSTLVDGSSSTAQFGAIQAITLDQQGNLLISEISSNCNGSVSLCF